MTDKKPSNFFPNMKAICDNFNATPIVLFARGSVKHRNALIMMAGPVLTLESINKLRAEIKECLDEKEKSLKGESGPDTAHVFY